MSCVFYHMCSTFFQLFEKCYSQIAYLHIRWIILSHTRLKTPEGTQTNVHQRNPKTCSPMMSDTPRIKKKDRKE